MFMIVFFLNIVVHGFAEGFYDRFTVQSILAKDMLPPACFRGAFFQHSYLNILQVFNPYSHFSAGFHYFP